MVFRSMADLPTKSRSDDLARVRLVLQRELETISHYEQLAHEAQDPELRAFFAHLAFEEKEHVAEATFFLRKLDPAQETHFAKGFTPAHFEGGAPAPGTAPSAPPAAAAAPVPTPAAGEISVGKPNALNGPASAPHPQPQKMMYGVPGLTSPSAGTLTVGPLKRRGG
jgi:hypothetical protein